MNFTRETLPGDSIRSGPMALCAQLTPDCWTIEAGYSPPRSHDPEQLPLGDGLIGGLALSLGSATIIGLSLGPALVGRLGHALGPLAGLALHELIVNAVIHGNLQVEFGSSGEWGDLAVRQAAIAEALADPSRANRVVTIAAGWRASEVVVVIADEGKGYDFVAPQTSKRGSGRGLRLARMVGRVEVLAGGSQTAIIMHSLVASKSSPM